MAIQHRDIPDTERHEVKGASTASPHTVLVSNGDGTTTFKRISVQSLEGTVDASVAGRHLVTDGAGGIQSTDAAYARFNMTAGVLEPLVLSRFNTTGVTFSPDVSGWYMYHAEVVGSPMKMLQNTTLGTTVSDAVSGLVYLDSTNQYSIDTDGYFSLVGVQ